jgi:hypothetical protein
MAGVLRVDDRDDELHAAEYRRRPGLRRPSGGPKCAVARAAVATGGNRVSDADELTCPRS